MFLQKTVLSGTCSYGYLGFNIIFDLRLKYPLVAVCVLIPSVYDQACTRTNVPLTVAFN